MQINIFTESGKSDNAAYATKIKPICTAEDTGDLDVPVGFLILVVCLLLVFITIFILVVCCMTRCRSVSITKRMVAHNGHTSSKVLTPLPLYSWEWSEDFGRSVAVMCHRIHGSFLDVNFNDSFLVDFKLDIKQDFSR